MMERDQQLMEYPFSKNITLTLPTNLLAILKGLAMTIQQAEYYQNHQRAQALRDGAAQEFPDFHRQVQWHRHKPFAVEQEL